MQIMNHLKWRCKSSLCGDILFLVNIKAEDPSYYYHVHLVESVYSYTVLSWDSLCTVYISRLPYRMCEHLCWK